MVYFALFLYNKLIIYIDKSQNTGYNKNTKKKDVEQKKRKAVVPMYEDTHSFSKAWRNCQQNVRF